MKIKFLSLEEIIIFHKDQIERFGGIHGIRDLGLLKSAILEPQSTFDQKYLYKNLYEMAAAYAYGFIKNHPFIDGNKRMAAVSMLVFMKDNYIKINLNNDNLYNIIINLTTGELNFENLVKSLKS